MRMVRDFGSVDRFDYLARLGLAADDANRLEVIEDEAPATGIYVNALTGDSQLILGGDLMPDDGVWIAQREIDDLTANGRGVSSRSGFGEGWGAQEAQLGGDRFNADEDSGGARRVPHIPTDASTDPHIDQPMG